MFDVLYHSIQYRAIQYLTLLVYIEHLATSISNVNIVTSTEVNLLEYQRHVSKVLPFHDTACSFSTAEK